MRRAGGVGGAAQGATARERELRRMRDGRGLHCTDHVRRVVVGALADETLEDCCDDEKSDSGEIRTANSK